MIVYRSTKAGFSQDVQTGRIDEIILERVIDEIGRGVGVSEQRAWRESLQSTNTVLLDPGIPDESGVGIEYQIPLTSKRIDFLLSGTDEGDRKRAVIVELKQWESAE